MMADLVERVNDVLMSTELGSRWRGIEVFEQSKVVVAIVLEEAAKVVEMATLDPRCSYGCSLGLSAAIRALAEPDA